jgi:peroxiredoxin
LAAWEAAKDKLAELEATIYAVSVDGLEEAKQVAATGLSFTVGYGATKEDAAAIGAWWSEDRGGFIQPAEFMLSRSGVVLGSMYASGPVGRMAPEEAAQLIVYRERQRQEQEANRAR